MEFNNKEGLTTYLKENKLYSDYVKYTDYDNQQDVVHMIYFDKDFYTENFTEYTSFNKDISWSEKDIIETIEERGYINLDNKGVLYEVDSYCQYSDFVKYPIRDVSIISEEECLRELIKNGTSSLADCYIK